MHRPSVRDRVTDIRRNRRLLALLALIIAGTLLAVFRPFDLDDVITIGERLAGNPLTAGVLIVVQAIMLALALPGTLIIWLVAPFYEPPLATVILTIGSTLGAIGGYALARRLGGDAPAAQSRGAVMRFLQRYGNRFSTQFALRVLPGFPHSVLNYGAGTLRFNLPAYILATLSGLAIKWWVYSAAIYELAAAGVTGEPPDRGALIPLLGLALLMVIGGAARAWVEKRNAR